MHARFRTGWYNTDLRKMKIVEQFHYVKLAFVSIRFDIENQFEISI